MFYLNELAEKNLESPDRVLVWNLQDAAFRVALGRVAGGPRNPLALALTVGGWGSDPVPSSSCGL